MLGYGLGVWPDGTLQAGPVAPPPPGGGSAFAYNLGFARHYSSNRPFLNLVKLAQYWKANNGASVPLDSDFYPAAMPAGASVLTSDLAIDDVETGLLANNIHVFWDGDGTVDLGFGGAVQFSEPNHFIYAPIAGLHRFEITDLGTTGVTNMRVVRDDHLALLNAGEIYNPDWFNIVSKAGNLRFLNWLTVNGNNSDEIWANRSVESRYSYLFRIPYEIVIDICNRAQADLWYQSPNRVGQDFAEGIAALVRDTLDPALTCYVELSNETWNSSFDQTLYYIAKGVEDWGTPGAGTVSLTKGSRDVVGAGTTFTSEFSPQPVLVAADGQLIEVQSIESDTAYTSSRLARRDATDAPFAYSNVYQGASSYVKYATQFAKWWNGVHPTRSKHILGGQMFSTSNVQSLIDASAWQANEPANWEARAVTMDGIAVTTYYGSHIDGPEVAEMNAALVISEDAMLQVLDGHIRSGANTTLSGIATHLRDHHRKCRAAGLELHVYEGGSHIVHPAPGLSEPERNDLLAHFVAWVNSDYCTAFHQDLLDLHKAFVDGPFMQFDAVSAWGNTVAWGAYQTPDYPGDKRSEFIESLAEAGRFWGGDIAPQQLKPIPDITGDELQAIPLTRLDVCFTANTLTYTAQGLPAGLSVDPSTGDITGFPEAGEGGAGTYTITAINAAGSVQASGAYNIAAHVPVDPLTIQDARIYDLTDGANLSATTGPASFGISPGSTVAEIANIGDAVGFNMVFDQGVNPVFDGDGATWSDKGVFLSADVPIANEARSMFIAAHLTSDGGIVYGGAGGSGQRTYLSYATANTIGAAAGGFGDAGSNTLNDDVSLKDVNAVIGFVHDGVRNRVFVNGVEKVDLAASGTCGTLADNALGTFVGPSGALLNLGFEGKIFAVVDVPFAVSDGLNYDITTWLAAKMS